MDTQRRSSVATFMIGANFAKYSATMAGVAGMAPPCWMKWRTSLAYARLVAFELAEAT